jgi:hypothetical protein
MPWGKEKQETHILQGPKYGTMSLVRQIVKKNVETEFEKSGISTRYT